MLILFPRQQSLQHVPFWYIHLLEMGMTDWRLTDIYLDQGLIGGSHVEDALVDVVKRNEQDDIDQEHSSSYDPK